MTHDMAKILEVEGEVHNELARAISLFPPMASAHEGYAVIKEELDELWEEVRRKNRSTPAMRAEAMQVAAMGIRFMLDVCSEP